MVAISAIGILICFALLVLSSWKNISTVLIAAIGAGIVGLLGGAGFIDSITGPYMTGFTSFVQSWIIVFALGGLLGGLYSKSGAAWRIGDVLVRRAGTSLSLVAIVIFGCILVYGGMNAPIAVLIVFPLARTIFPKVGIPWYLFPGVAGLATCTVGLYFPGSLSVVNLVPLEALGVTTTAAPVEGIIGCLFLLVVGILYLKWEIKKGQNTLAVETPEHYLGKADVADDAQMDKVAPSFLFSIIPLIVTLILVDIVKIHIILGFGTGCIVALILFWKSLEDKIKAVTSSFNDGIMPCILVAAISGLGSVISTTPAFDVIRDAILNLPVGGLVKVSISTTLISGICGSGSGGLQMALNLLGDEFMTFGYPADIIARVASIACGGLDSLPWNGTVVMMFSLCGVGIGKSYKQVFVLTCMLPILASLVTALAYTIIH